MKNTYWVLIIIVMLSLMSCSEKSISTTVIIDIDRSRSTDQITLNYGSKVTPPENQGGKMVFSFETSESGYYYITDNSTSIPLFLMPGDSIFIHSDYKRKSNPEPFSGTGSIYNNYIRKDDIFINNINDSIDFDSIFSLAPTEFVKSIDSIHNLRVGRLEDFIESHHIRDEVFISTERSRIYYQAAIEKNHYYRDHKFLTGELVSLGDDFDKYLNLTNINDTTLLHLKECKDFLYTYFERIGLEEFDSQKHVDKESVFTELSFVKAQKQITDTKIRSYVLYRIMDVHLNETPINDIGNLIDRFNEGCQTDAYKEKINTYYSKLEKLKAGNMAPDFSFPNARGDIVSLSDFRGSLVYIDVWNSFCSPCFKEFPILEKIIDQFGGGEVVFIGISFDDDQDLWKNTMAKKNLRGIQLFANGWNSQFTKDYLVYSNPRFIFIDRDGSIIDAKAPRPSGNIDEILSLHL